jgi:hypothetical protein
LVQLFGRFRPTALAGIIGYRQARRGHRRQLLVAPGPGRLFYAEALASEQAGAWKLAACLLGADGVIAYD